MNAGQTTDHEQLAEEVVRGFFDALYTSDSVEEGGMGSQRELLEGDLKDLSPEEFYDALKQTEYVLYHLWDLVGEMNHFGAVVLCDAQNRTRAALRRVEEARGEPREEE